MLTSIPAAPASLSDAVWIDLLEPTDEERQRVEQATGLRLPTRGDIEEIESSSRVYIEGDIAYLSTPVIENTDCVNGRVTSVGFVLAPSRLVTVRFGAVTAFNTVATRLGGVAGAPVARDVFLKIVEEIVENTADALEHASAELERISHDAFHRDRPRRYKLAEASEALRGALRKLGRMGDGISHVRDALLGLGRIAAFAHENSRDGQPVDQPRSQAIRADILSLNDYQAHLSGKVQFLLDATLGFISIEQNDVVKTLTVVSVVGVPPVVIAGIYGMNFHHMPELDWTFGYPISIGLMIASALLPLAWFKWRGWL